MNSLERHHVRQYTKINCHQIRDSSISLSIIFSDLEVNALFEFLKAQLPFTLLKKSWMFLIINLLCFHQLLFRLNKHNMLKIKLDKSRFNGMLTLQNSCKVKV